MVMKAGELDKKLSLFATVSSTYMHIFTLGRCFSRYTIPFVHLTLRAYMQSSSTKKKVLHRCFFPNHKRGQSVEGEDENIGNVCMCLSNSGVTLLTSIRPVFNALACMQA